MNKRSEETQTLRAGGAKIIRTAADPLRAGAGRPKFNQLNAPALRTGALSDDARLTCLSRKSGIGLSRNRDA